MPLMLSPEKPLLEIKDTISLMPRRMYVPSSSAHILPNMTLAPPMHEFRGKFPSVVCRIDKVNEQRMDRSYSRNSSAQSKMYFVPPVVCTKHPIQPVKFSEFVVFESLVQAVISAESTGHVRILIRSTSTDQIT